MALALGRRQKTTRPESTCTPPSRGVFRKGTRWQFHRVPHEGVRPIGVSIPNIGFVEGDPVAFENFTNLFLVAQFLMMLKAFRRSDPVPMPDHRPEHRSPLVRQSLDCLLGIAPRDAGLGVLSGRVAFNVYPGLKHPTSQSLRRGWLFGVTYHNMRGAIASATAAWANLFSRCAAIHASTSGLTLVPRRKCPNTWGRCLQRPVSRTRLPHRLFVEHTYSPESTRCKKRRAHCGLENP